MGVEAHDSIGWKLMNQRRSEPDSHACKIQSIPKKEIDIRPSSCTVREAGVLLFESLNKFSGEVAMNFSAPQCLTRFVQSALTPIRRRKAGASQNGGGATGGSWYF